MRVSTQRITIHLVEPLETYVGLDFSSGKPPSTMQLMKLGMKKEVRDGMIKLTTEAQKAGIDLTNKVLYSFDSESNIG